MDYDMNALAEVPHLVISVILGFTLVFHGIGGSTYFCIKVYVQDPKPDQTLFTNNRKYI